MKTDYYEIEIAPTKANYDRIYNRLYLEGIQNIVEVDGLVKICFKKNERKKVTGLIENLQRIPGVIPGNINLTELESYDWSKKWKNSIRPVFIRNKIVIHPSWKRNEIKRSKNRIYLEIDPRMSFGTGQNETTQMMLEMMCDYLEPGDKYMLDFGCGTGILSIAGVKLGLKSVIAIDIDNDSIRDANYYILKNNTSKNIKLFRKDISHINQTNFDIISANIDSKTVSKNLRVIRAKLRNGGKLFIGGILQEEKAEIKKKLQNCGFEIVQTRKKTEWTAFYARKR